MPQADTIRVWWCTESTVIEKPLQTMVNSGWNVIIVSSLPVLRTRASAIQTDPEATSPDAIFIDPYSRTTLADTIQQVGLIRRPVVAFSPFPDLNERIETVAQTAGLNVISTLGRDDPQSEILNPRKRTLLEQAIRMMRPPIEGQVGGRPESPRSRI